MITWLKSIVFIADTPSVQKTLHRFFNFLQGHFDSDDILRLNCPFVRIVLNYRIMYV